MRIFILETRIMNTKLTLTIEKSVIEKAKAYAKGSGRSLSDLIEAYLRNLTRVSGSSSDVPDEFSDLFGAVQLPDDFDEKAKIREIMTKKHG